MKSSLQEIQTEIAIVRLYHILPRQKTRFAICHWCSGTLSCHIYTCVRGRSSIPRPFPGQDVGMPIERPQGDSRTGGASTTSTYSGNLEVSAQRGRHDVVHHQGLVTYRWEINNYSKSTHQIEEVTDIHLLELQYTGLFKRNGALNFTNWKKTVDHIDLIFLGIDIQFMLKVSCKKKIKKKN